MKRTCTLKDVLDWGPCFKYTEKHLKKLFAGRRKVTAKGIVKMRISLLDKIWAICHLMRRDEMGRVIDEEKLIPTGPAGTVASRGTVDAVWGFVAGACTGYDRWGDPIYAYDPRKARRALAAMMKILDEVGR